MSSARHRSLAIACLIALTTAPASPAADETKGPGLSARLHEKMKTFVDKKEISGAVTLVGTADAVISLDAVGERDLLEDLTMRTDSIFRIASMTKPVTATAVMILADEGKLSVDDPVETYLPEFKGQMQVAARTDDSVTLKKPPRPITLRDLLTHTSGLPGSPPPGLSDLYAKRNHTLAEAVMAYSQRPLDFEPGSKWAYCNTGIDTLGRVVEVVSGQSYESFLQDRLFGPLGMADTTFYPSPAQVSRLAITYDKKEGQLLPVASSAGPPAGKLYPVPAGGLYSTAADLAHFYQMVLRRGELGGKRYLSGASVDEMTRVQTGDLKAGFTDGKGWGLGWGVVKKPTGVTRMLSPGTFGHGGAWGTQAWVDPNKGRFAVLLIQRAGLKNSDESEIRGAMQEDAFAD